MRDGRPASPPSDSRLLPIRAGVECGFVTRDEAVQKDAEPNHEYGWVSPYHFGINQGPILMMIENYRCGFLWSQMRQCPYLVTSLGRAGFTGGWLE